MIDVRNAIKLGDIRPTRSLGQNFLTDRAVAQRIVEAAELTHDDNVIEVGPGVCALTELIAKSARTVTAVEIDKHLIEDISEVMSGYTNFRLINADILKIDPRELLPDGVSKIKLISNLPYYISTAVMMRFFEDFPIAERAVLTMQREVADRLTAKPGTKAYGALTVAVNYYAVPKRLFIIPPHCFVPQPDVDSAVVVIDARKTPNGYTTKEREYFFRVVHAAFAQRRKTLANNLISSGLVKNRAQALDALARASVNEDARGETLGIDEFLTLTRVLDAEDRKRETGGGIACQARNPAN